jgi:catechol 2,3-dioxygenase-like lactoylglutathione lyase family enzyme
MNFKNTDMPKSKLLEMNNVGIVVESLDNAISFFTEIGLKLEGRAMVEGEWAGRVTGLGNQSVEVAMMVTPDGHSRLELSRFLTPQTIGDHRTAPVNSLGYLRIMFRVDDLDELLPRLVKHGAVLAGEVVQYEDIYKLCYIRGTEGLLIGLAEQLGNKTAADILEK